MHVFAPVSPVRLACFAIVLLSALAGSTASRATAQLRPVVIRDATILVGDGTRVDPGAVLFKDGKIEAVASKVDGGMLARKISAKGKFVTPGLIDVYGSIAARCAVRAGRPTARAAEVFDRYAEDEIRSALEQGVTAEFITARSADGFGGTGCVVRLTNDPESEQPVLSSDSVLCAAINGMGGNGPLARVRSVADLRRQFIEAREYRKALEDYEEDLKDYEKKVAERAAREAKEPPKEKPRTPARPPEPAPDSPQREERRQRPGRRPRPRPGEIEAPNSAPRISGDIQDSAPAGDDDHSSDVELSNTDPLQTPPPPQPQPGQPGQPPGEKKDEIKKPQEPRKDADKDLLLKLLDGELSLRVEAQRPQDILNILDLAQEFNFALIIEGGAGAHRVAKELAESHTPVVLGFTAPGMLFDPGALRDAAMDAAATLHRAGVDVYLGSGPLSGEAPAPRLALSAAMSVAAGLDENLALELLTSRAARFLGIARKLGRVAPGLSADLVVWSDHPFAAGARVERVFIEGREVYRAGEEPESRERPAPRNTPDSESEGQ